MKYFKTGYFSLLSQSTTLIMCLTFNAFTQDRITHLDISTGIRVQNKVAIIKSPLLINIGKIVETRKNMIKPYIEFESNFSGWKTVGVGLSLYSIQRYFPKQTYLVADFFIPVQNKLHKQEQNMGVVVTRFGVGHLSNYTQKIEVMLGFSENWKPYLELRYAQLFKIRRRRTIDCFY